jgi:Protein of unknown function (DUF3562)
MNAQPRQESHQQRAIEFLAKESEASVDEVARLYDSKRAELGVGARITGLLPILALRRVRELLRQGSVGKPSRT